MPHTHAVLSPSAASRWISCPPSARLEEKAEESTSSAANEGTLAHSLGELLIKGKLGLIKSPEPSFSDQYKIIKANPQYEQAMYDYCDDYATYVIEQFAEAQKHTKDALLFLEQKLDLTDYVPEGFGTGDAIIIANEWLTLIDLKYGKGVPVSSTENKQMMLYGLGALKEFEMFYDIRNVRMTIYQPRIDNISTFDMSVSDLKDWAENELKPKAALAFEGKGEFVAGTHCRFCKVKATCRANSIYNLKIIKEDFKDPIFLEDTEISEILDKSDQFKKWVGAVEEYAFSEALKGKRWPNMKLVAGRSSRIYTDETQIIKVLTEHAFHPLEKIMEPQQLLGVTKLEKVLGKTEFEVWVSDYIIKPPGKLTLVDVSDKRPEYNSIESAREDFKNI